MRRPEATPGGTPVQLGLDELGTPLHEVTFVVLDLETTGGKPGAEEITEIGAVKVRGGEVVGEFQTLVNPGVPVPPRIAVLTGITTAMVVDAPRIREVLPSFWEFIHGAVLVAHNASFDIGHLKAAASAMDLAWPGNRVVDTVALARRVVTRDEAPNHKLSTLAALFRATTTPEHRALADARATVDVLHALLGRLAPWGITHLEDLTTATDPVPPEVRRKKGLAAGLPSGPGVYLFHGPGDEVLYVGTSVDVRKRVQSYFTASEKRRRMTEMLRIAERVSAVPCATRLEARVRELRLITQHSPRYNRRSRFPERMPWVRLTDEDHPRLSVVNRTVPESVAPAVGRVEGQSESADVSRTEPADRSGVGASQRGALGEPSGRPGAVHIGPFLSRRTAQLAVEAVQGAIDLRQCTRRLPRVAPAGTSACQLLDLGRCSGPCVAPQGAEGDPAREQHDAAARAVLNAFTTSPGAVVEPMLARIARLAQEERYEQAATERDRLAAFLEGTARRERFQQLALCSELVAARRVPSGPGTGGWEIVVVRYGRLAGTAVAPAGTDPYLTIDAATATAEHVDPPVAPATAAHPEETLILLDWLADPHVRLVRTTRPATCAVRGAQSYATVSDQARRGRATTATIGDDDRTRHDVAPVPVGARPGRMVLETAGTAPAARHERTPR
ncbi:DEDD exonuclease domain-containing protein [Flavimobilis soli]|uniref:DEDD exonuclease domain-containing protein n=1 Tax=Flavimobilis soli TaxID=442709 RepID=UPI000BF95227|nr:DEDD exonuclease domain-containing protein [Flavimobilis soli]